MIKRRSSCRPAAASKLSMQPLGNSGHWPPKRIQFIATHCDSLSAVWPYACSGCHSMRLLHWRSCWHIVLEACHTWYGSIWQSAEKYIHQLCFSGFCGYLCSSYIWHGMVWYMVYGRVQPTFSLHSSDMFDRHICIWHGMVLLMVIFIWHVYSYVVFIYAQIYGKICEDNQIFLLLQSWHYSCTISDIFCGHTLYLAWLILLQATKFSLISARSLNRTFVRSQFCCQINCLSSVCFTGYYAWPI